MVDENGIPEESDNCQFNEKRNYCFYHKCGEGKECGKEAGCPHHYTFGVIQKYMCAKETNEEKSGT